MIFQGFIALGLVLGLNYVNAQGDQEPILDWAGGADADCHNAVKQPSFPLFSDYALTAL